jgi:hypothetical protein
MSLDHVCSAAKCLCSDLATLSTLPLPLWKRSLDVSSFSTAVITSLFHGFLLYWEAKELWVGKKEVWDQWHD